MSELERSLSELRAALASYRVSKAHFVPDIALRGLVNDVEENAGVVAALRGHDLRHRAYANARAAGEASQLALLLATADDYDVAGARAWVYYLRQDREFATRRRTTPVAGSDDLTPDERYRAALEEMAELWEGMAPGKRDVLVAAQELVEAQPKRPDNFLGVAVAPALRDRIGRAYTAAGRTPPVDVAAAYNNAYAASSRQAHPRASLRPSSVRSRPGEQTVVVEYEPIDRDFHLENAVLLANAAVLEALAALRVQVQRTAI